MAGRSDEEGASGEVVRRYIEVVWNGGDIAALGGFVSDGHLRHDPAGDSRGIAELGDRITAFRTAFPNLHFEIDVYVANDGGVTVIRRWVMTGTHLGEYAGVAATGREVSSTGMAISRIEGGLIAEEWINRDDLGLLRFIREISI